MVLNVHRNHKAYLGRGEGGEGVWRWEERESIYLSLHCHHQNDFCIKMGNDESHFNVSVGSDGQSHKTVSTNHNLFEEKREPKRYRTEVLPLTSLTPYRWAKPAHGLFVSLTVWLYGVCSSLNCCAQSGLEGQLTSLTNRDNLSAFSAGSPMLQ